MSMQGIRYLPILNYQEATLLLRHIWASKLLTIFGHTNRDALVVSTEGTHAAFTRFNGA